MKTLNNILSLIPAILAAVVAIEQQFGNSVPGSTKKQLILQSIQVGAAIGETADNKTVQGISALVDNTVGFLNSNRLLGFAPSTPTVSQPAPSLTPEQLKTVAPGYNAVVR